MRNLWDLFIAYCVPGPVYRLWMNWLYLPVRYRCYPWTPSACETCPECQRLGLPEARGFGQ